MSFIDDIQGKNTHLYPIVTIEPDYIANYNDVSQTPHPYSQVIHLSTNNVSLDHIHSLNYNIPVIEGVHFKPLLLNIPSIKESIDIESRKFKISNVSLDISNIEYEGKRFTDILSDTSLINWKCSIQFVSPSAKMFSTIFTSGWHELSFYDFYKDDPESAPLMTQMVYQGIIRRISHDDTKVKIELEDLTAKKAHKDLPQAIDQNEVVGVLGEGENVPDKYKNAPIPICYGHVDRSPLVIGENYRKFIIDSKAINGTGESQSEFGNVEGPLYIYAQNNYLGVESTSPEGTMAGIAQYEFPIISNYFALNPSNKDIFPEDDLEPRMYVLDNSRNFILNISQPKNPALLNDDFIDEAQLNAITDGDTTIENNIELLSSRDIVINSAISDDNMEILLLRMDINYTPSYDFASIKLKGLVINGYNVTDSLNTYALDGNYFPVFSEDVAHETENSFSDQVGGLSDDYVYGNDPNLTSGTVPENEKWNNIISFTNAGDTNPNPTNPPNEDGAGGADLHFDVTRTWSGNYAPSHKDADLLLLESASWNNTLTIDFRTLYWFNITGDDIYNNGDSYQTFNFSLTGNLNNISLLRGVSVLKPLSYDFYANVKGRINTFDDHPSGFASDWTCYSTVYYIVTTLSDVEGISYEYEAGITVEYGHNMWLAMQSYIETGNAVFGFDLGEMTEEEQATYTQQMCNNAEEFIANLGITEDSFNIIQDGLIQNPIDIIYDLVRGELGHDAIDEAEYLEAKKAHDGWKFGFTQTKKINSIKLIQDIAKSTKCFPKFKNDGTFGFNTIKDSYTVSDIVDGVETGDYNAATLIKESEVISYSFKKTKPEQIYKNVTVSYYKDYAQDSYLKTTKSADPDATSVYDLGADPYYGIESSSDAHLEFESDYIRHKGTANALVLFLSKQYRNDHLLFNFKLPLQYINLEIGDLVKFRDLFVKAYGIDYRRIEAPNEQYYYPLFMVTATTKNLDSVSIECMQLHHISDDAIDSAWQDDTIHDDGTEGLFYFPDAEPLVLEPYLFAPDVVTTEFVETDDSIETDNLFVKYYGERQRPYIVNIDDTFNFEDYNGGDGEQNVFDLGGYIQIKNYTDSIIVRLSSVILGADDGGFQKIQLGNQEGSFFYEDADTEGLSSFLKPDGWEEGDALQILEITRMTPVVAVASSGAFNDKVKDLVDIKDIGVW